MQVVRTVKVLSPNAYVLGMKGVSTVLQAVRSWVAERQGEAPAADRQQAEAACVLAKHPARTGIIGRHGLLEAGLTARLEGQDRLRVLLCGWAGLLSAWS